MFVYASGICFPPSRLQAPKLGSAGKKREGQEMMETERPFLRPSLRGNEKWTQGIPAFLDRLSFFTTCDKKAGLFEFPTTVLNSALLLSFRFFSIVGPSFLLSLSNLMKGQKIPHTSEYYLGDFLTGLKKKNSGEKGGSNYFRLNFLS